MNLNYKVEGEGKAIVFIHGLSDDLRYWEVLTSNLKRYYNVIRFDLRGHGESELGEDEISIGLFSDDLHNLLNELNIEKVNLVGFSLGGAVALDFYFKHSSMVSSIVLMSSFSKITPHSREVLNRFLEAIDIGFEEFYDLIIPMVLCPDVIAKNKEVLEYLKKESAKSANCKAINNAIVACLNFDVWDRLSDINVPTLVLTGKYDEISLVEEQKEMSEQINSSKLIIFDNLRHNLLVGKNIVKIIDILKEFYK